MTGQQVEDLKMAQLSLMVWPMIGLFPQDGTFLQETGKKDLIQRLKMRPLVSVIFILSAMCILHIYMYANCAHRCTRHANTKQLQKCGHLEQPLGFLSVYTTTGYKTAHYTDYFCRLSY
jgi:hypothetical protein